jgi:hypothetical protein
MYQNRATLIGFLGKDAEVTALTKAQSSKKLSPTESPISKARNSIPSIRISPSSTWRRNKRGAFTVRYRRF